MSLIKKDLIALADMIRNLIPTPNASADSGVYHIPGDSFTGAVRQWEETRDALADFCAAQNPRFNRARWLAYIAGEVGPNGGSVAPLRALRRHVTGAIERGEAQAIIEQR